MGLLTCLVRKNDDGSHDVMFGGHPESLLWVDYAMVEEFKPIAEQFGFRRKAFSDDAHAEFYKAIDSQALKLGEWLPLNCHGQKDSTLHDQAFEQAPQKVQAGR